jgi:hypothetical protein
VADDYADLIAAAGQLPNAPAPAQAAPATDAYQDLIDAAAAPAPPPAQPKPAPNEDRGFLDAVVNGLGNGLNFGGGAAVQAGLTTAVSKVPWLRDMAAKVPGIDPTVANPDITYDQRREAAKRVLDDAAKYHPIANTFSELAGNTLATLAAPESEALQAASPLLRGAVAGGGYGAAQGVGEGLSEGKSIPDALANAGRSATAGALTGGLLEGAAGKLLREAPEKADQWIVKELAGTDHATNPTATAKKQLANDAKDIRDLVKSDPELAKASDQAAHGKIEDLQQLQNVVQDRLAAERGPRLERYEKVIDPESEHGGMRVGDIVKPLEDKIASLDIGDDKVKRALSYWRDQIKEGWGTRDRVTIDPEAQLTPGFTAQKALENYRARLAEATPEERPTIEAVIKEIEDEFGTKERVFDPNTVIPTTRFRKLVTKTGEDVANAIGTIDEKARYQHLRDVERPFQEILNNHLDAVAARSPAAEKAVQETRAANNRISALLNVDKVVKQRINKATSNSLAGMRPAFGIRGAIHQAVGPGLPGVVAATVLGHPAVAAGLALTTVAPGAKRIADKALAGLIMHANAGSISAKLVEDAIAAGVPRAVATQIAASAHKGVVGNVISNVAK